MMRRQLARVLVTLALSCGLTAEARAQMFVTTGRDTLRGLPGIEVIVEMLPPELAQHGLTTAGIREGIVGRLRANGITVYRSQDENPSTAKPYLYVLVNGLELPGAAVYAAGIQVHLRQTLQSPVTESNIVNAMTWDAHTVLAIPHASLPALHEEVQDFIDLFIRDWQAVQR